jgi:hypothetical protein
LSKSPEENPQTQFHHHLQAVYPKYGALHPNVLAKFILPVKISREAERDSGCVFGLLKTHRLHGSLLKRAVDVNLVQGLLHAPGSLSSGDGMTFLSRFFFLSFSGVSRSNRQE